MTRPLCVLKHHAIRDGRNPTERTAQPEYGEREASVGRQVAKVDTPPGFIPPSKQGR